MLQCMNNCTLYVVYCTFTALVVQQNLSCNAKSIYTNRANGGSAAEYNRRDIIWPKEVEDEEVYE